MSGHAGAGWWILQRKQVVSEPGQYLVGTCVGEFIHMVEMVSASVISTVELESETKTFGTIYCLSLPVTIPYTEYNLMKPQVIQI